MEDRRQYYRINDQVSLNYYVIGKANPDKDEKTDHQSFRELAEL